MSWYLVVFPPFVVPDQIGTAIVLGAGAHTLVQARSPEDAAQMARELIGFDPEVRAFVLEGVVTP